MDADPYGIAWDGSVFWIGNYNGTFFGYQIDDAGMTQVGSFDAPVAGFSAITYDGSSFLVSPVFDGGNTIYELVRWHDLQ